MAQIKLRTAAEIERERLDLKRDRYGHNDPIDQKPSFSRITYMCHAKGWVMARCPNCLPFVISERLWLSFDYWDDHSRKEIS